MDVESWTCQTVGEWLDDNGFSDYKKLLTEDHKIDGSVLTTLSESDLRQPPLQIAILGDIKRLMKAIDKLCKSDHKKHVSNSRLLRNGNSEVVHRTKYLRLESRESESGDGDEALTELITRTGRHKELNHPDAEIWKTILSFLYMCGVLMITAFVMVLVHERVPDVHKYPPLPDLFLDNVPYIPWAFKATELIAVCLGTVWFTLLFFHKHRFVLMRRMFSLTGTLFLLRSVCMLITSLSVPSTHLQCEGRSYGDIWEKLQRTWEIWSGFGMTLQGVRTCGDYMFSGHTVCVTLLNFFITEYTSRKYYYVHTFTWVANLFAIFFILAAHEHYSLDVFVAFYLTSRLFLYYHTLANNRSLMLRDKKRTRIWFPLFSLFESKCEGVVPNEYEWPQERLAECVRKYWVKVQEMSKRKKKNRVTW